jgi:hypothetical protein
MRDGPWNKSKQLNHFRMRCQNIMTDSMIESNNQPLVDPRANLFYLLQQLSREAEVKHGKRGSESPVFDESGLDAWHATKHATPRP